VIRQRNAAADAARALVSCGLVLCSGSAMAGSFSFLGLDADTQLSATYSAAMRTESPSGHILNPAPSDRIPIADVLKVSQYNYDDGDRNFNKGSLVNNRLTFLGEIKLSKDDYGLVLRGDAFYDRAYRKLNDNDSPDTINKVEEPTNQFTSEARYRDGRRTRLLDAYVYDTFYFGDQGALDLRIGRQVVAWGESLFFDGIALSQAPADATKATVPGADVKSILLPVNQIAATMTVTDDLTFLGQYKLEFKPTELNPVGEFFSPADVVGPGAEFIYGIKNPLYLSNLAGTNLLSSDTLELVQTVTNLLKLPDIASGLIPLVNALNPLLPNLPLPVGQIQQPGQPKYINVQRGNDIKPSDFGQWGLGARYKLNDITTLGVYQLRYHSTTPTLVQNYGYAPLLVAPNGSPILTTQALGVQVPVTYNVKYFDGIDMSAMSLSTSLFGANIGMDVTYRHGVDVLVDVDGGILGPVPTPVRADVGQIQISSLYTIGPRWFWDSLTFVTEIGYNNVYKHDEACGPSGCTRDLTYTRDASAVQTLLIFDKKNVFPAWDASIPVVLGMVIDGHSSLVSGFGNLMGPGDYRASVGINFTRLQALTLGVAYNAYIGRANYIDAPYQDRDNLSVTAKYNF
jgi:hypothetical protein